VSHLTAISKALDFVEDNLKEEIAVADMARAAGYSLYHFSRTFNGVVHHTPYDYLMRRRLSESARDLVETDRRIIDVAFDYRFNSPETFSRAFKRMFGLQPSGWKAQGRADERFLMCRWTLEHLEHINKGDYLKPVSEEKDAFQVAGVMTLVQNRQEVIPHLWEMLAQELACVEGSRTDGNYYGITWYPQDWKERGRFYMVAVGVESPHVTSSALVVKTIPVSRYARFVHKGSREDLQLTRDYIYQTWLPKSGESLAHSLEIACYGRELNAVQADVEWEVLIPIKRM
jgi:AraC family transcriptional regulator